MNAMSISLADVMHNRLIVITTRSMSPNNARAFYERGAALLHLGRDTGLVDINKALSIDPSLWQVRESAHESLASHASPCAA